MKWLSILMLMTASCMGDANCDSDWFGAAGLTICDNDLGISSEEVEYLVDVLEDEISSRDRYSDITDLKKTFKNGEVEVIFTDKHITVGCEEVDKYGDIYVDTNKSHEVYKEWLKMTRPAPGPDGLRRPFWFKRPLKPEKDIYYCK